MIVSRKYSWAIIVPGLILAISYFFANPGGISVYSTQKNYANVMGWLQQGLVDKGYEIEKIQPIDKGLGRAGININTYRVVFYNPKHTLTALQRKYPAFTVLLPLSITVAKENKNLKIIGSPYKLLLRSAKGHDLQATIKRWRKDSDDVIRQALKKAEPVLKNSL